MNGYIFRKIALCGLMISFVSLSYGQKLKSLIPDAGIIQFAGSIGFFSAGISYDVFENKRGNLDLMYGYVPESRGGKLSIASIKFAYRPWEFNIHDHIKIYPFNPGIFFTYTFHPDLSFNFDTSQYPKGYYYWSEAIRPHLSISNEVEFDTKKFFKGTAIRAVSIYSEFNTNDYYVVNYFQNMSALRPSDVFQLGIGLKLKF